MVKYLDTEASLSKASLLRKLGKYSSEILVQHDKALIYREDALKMLKKLNIEGQYDSELAKYLNDIGGSYSQISSFDEARHSFNEAFQVLENLYHGADHKDIAISLNGIGYIYLMQKKWTKAYDFLKKALDIRLRLYETNSDNLLLKAELSYSYNNVGEACRNTPDKLEEAKQYFQTSFKILKEIYPNGHPNIAGAINSQGLTFRTQGLAFKAQGLTNEAKNLFEEALRNFEVAYEEYTKHYQGDHHSKALVINNKGLASYDLERYEDAFNFHNAAYEMNQRIYHGKDHITTAMILTRMGMTCQELGRFEDSVKYHKLSISMDKGNVYLELFSKRLNEAHAELEKHMQKENQYVEESGVIEIDNAKILQTNEHTNSSANEYFYTSNQELMIEDVSSMDQKRQGIGETTETDDNIVG